MACKVRRKPNGKVGVEGQTGRGGRGREQRRKILLDLSRDTKCESVLMALRGVRGGPRWPGTATRAIMLGTHPNIV